MACKFCQSAHQGGFPAEINTHFPDKENLTRTHLVVVSKAFDLRGLRLCRIFGWSRGTAEA
jgi:hypothetical protein